MRFKVFFFIFIILVCGALAYRYSKTQAGTILVKSGDSVDSAARALADAHIVKSPIAFKVAYKLFGHGALVFPGIVDVPASCSLSCIVDQLTSTKRRSTRLIFKEGEDLRDLARIIEDKKLGTRAQLFALIGEPAITPTKHSIAAPVYAAAPRQISLEGYLFPDTYNISEDMGVEGLVKTMLLNFDKKFTPAMRAQAAAQGRSVHDIVTVASILEREVRGHQDRQMVADIMWRRLGKGIGLQVDSSVNYATAKENKFTTASDRATVSLWNTYKFKGLPLGPIGNPGSDALQAALTPKSNDFFYYLTAPDGTVHYGRTLDDQIANKKYLR